MKHQFHFVHYVGMYMYVPDMISWLTEFGNHIMFKRKNFIVQDFQTNILNTQLLRFFCMLTHDFLICFHPRAFFTSPAKILGGKAQKTVFPFEKFMHR